MNQKEQIEFLSNIISGLRKNVMAANDKIPPTWNEAELAQYVADIFKKNYLGKMTPAQLKRYHNDIFMSENL